MVIFTIKPGKLIGQQLAFFLEKSGDPWSIKDREYRYLFINDAALYYYGIPKNFDYFGCLDSELPHPGAELAEEFQKNDKIIIEKEKTVIEIDDPRLWPKPNIAAPSLQKISIL